MDILIDKELIKCLGEAEVMNLIPEYGSFKRLARLAFTQSEKVTGSLMNWYKIRSSQYPNQQVSIEELLC